MGNVFPVVRFGDALRIVQDNLDAKNYYAYNPAIDIRPAERAGTNRNSVTNGIESAAAKTKKTEEKA